MGSKVWILTAILCCKLSFQAIAEGRQAPLAGTKSVTKQQVEDPILRAVQQFEGSLALDSVRKEYLLHRRIHERRAASAWGSAKLDELNEWIYAELFLTPNKDPWLGLAPADVYSALDGDGRVEPAETAGPRGG